MASRATRACLASQGEFSLWPLPALQLAEDELAQALEALWSGQQTLTPVSRERANGEPELIAQGDARQVPMHGEVAGKGWSWTERRLVGRSRRQARAGAAALRARVAQAVAALEACNRRGRGKQRFTAVAEGRQAAEAVLERYRVGDRVRLRDTEQVRQRPGRGYRNRPARVQEERPGTMEAPVDEAAVDAAGRRLGWRV